MPVPTGPRCLGRRADRRPFQFRACLPRRQPDDLRMRHQWWVPKAGRALPPPRGLPADRFRRRLFETATNRVKTSPRERPSSPRRKAGPAGVPSRSRSAALPITCPGWAQFGHSRRSRRYSDHVEVPVPLSAPGVNRTPDLQVRRLTNVVSGHRSPCEARNDAALTRAAPTSHGIRWARSGRYVRPVSEHSAARNSGCGNERVLRNTACARLGGSSFELQPPASAGQWRS